jgi:thioesterase domain-containing protein
MAQQLKQSNIEVVSVILLDSYIWTSNKELSHLNINSILEYILLKHASPNIKTIPEAISAEIRAIKSYYPTVPLLEREIVLLKAKRFNFDEINDQVNKADDFKNHLYQLFKDSSNGWKSIIKKLKIFNLDETHDNFLSENNIVHIAQIINQLMKDYEAKVTNSTENQFITNEVLQELC